MSGESKRLLVKKSLQKTNFRGLIEGHLSVVDINGLGKTVTVERILDN